MVIARRLIIGVCAVLLGVQVVRSAAVSSLSELNPDGAAKLWASHPDVEISAGLADIGKAAHAQKPIDMSVFARIDDAAAKMPLAAEPYLVRGVQAQTAGDMEQARRAFEAAQWRQPRSPAAAYFLADYDFRTNRLVAGLEQVTLLARLSPNGNTVVAPFIAAYTRNPANWPQIRSTLARQPMLQDDVLAVLAQDAANTDAILAIADSRHKRPDAAWLKSLLTALIDRGDFVRARAVWSSVGRGRPGTALLYDQDFRDATAPPPFNWSLASSNVGLAERQPGSRLHVIFYGNSDGVLASQLLTLSPGMYRLRMRFASPPVHAETLQWSIRCNKISQPLSMVPMAQATGAGWSFAVPQGCAGQWLELLGNSGDVAQQAEVTITGLSLVREGGNA